MSESAGNPCDWVVSLDAAVGDEHAESVVRVLRERLGEPAPFLIVDLSSADRLDGGHLATLLAASQASPRPFALVASGEVARGLREWRFDTHVRTFDGMDAAIAALGEEA